MLLLLARRPRLLERMLRACAGPSPEMKTRGSTNTGNGGFIPGLGLLGRHLVVIRVGKQSFKLRWCQCRTRCKFQVPSRPGILPSLSLREKVNHERGAENSPEIPRVPRPQMCAVCAPPHRQAGFPASPRSHVILLYVQSTPMEDTGFFLQCDVTPCHALNTGGSLTSGIHQH